MWIDKNTNETASHLETRLGTLLAEVDTSSHTSTSIAYSANGLILRQRETVSVKEFRSLTKDAADLLATQSSDTTNTSIYYRQIGDSNDYAAVAITVGDKINYVASRANEAGAWHVTKTTTHYAAASDTGWTTTRPTVSSTGIVVSQSSSKTFLSFGLGGAVYQNETVVVKEYPFLTYSEAVSKVTSETAAGSILRDEKLATQWSTTEGITAWKNVTVRGGSSSSSAQGTDKVPTMRFDGPERGWVVTVTETTYWGSSS